MAQINGYKEELQDELRKTDPDSHASRLLTQEIERLEKGDDRKESRSTAFIDVHPNQPQNVGLRIRIPARDYPKFNFVGKLLGPKGNTLKQLQEETGCKMAVLGRGSMRDKAKEEEMRKEGGKKFAHLNDELHLYVEAFAEMTEAYRRLSHAVSEVKKFLIPTSSGEEEEEEEGSALTHLAPFLEAFQTLLSQQLSAVVGSSHQPPPPGMKGLPPPPGNTPLRQWRPPAGPMLPPRGHTAFPTRPAVPRGGPGFPGGPVCPPFGPPFPVRGQFMPLRGVPGSQGPCPPFPLQPFPLAKKPLKGPPKPERKHTPWYFSIREEFHRLKRLKRRAERKWQKSRKAEDREAFVAAKRQVERLVNKAKAALESSTEPEGETKKSKNKGGKPEADLSQTAEDASEKGLSEDDGSSEDGTDDEMMGDAQYDVDNMDCGSLHKDLVERQQITDSNDDIRQQQMQEMMYMNSGDGRGGRGGGYRGGPSGRGGPASGRGAPVRGGATVAPGHGAPGRGAPGRGAPGRGAPGRGGVGAPPMHGGAARGRSAAPPAPPPQSSYEDYGYSSSGRGDGYDDGYSSRGYSVSSYRDDHGDSQYYSRSSREQSSSAGYDSYSAYDYGDSWGTVGGGGYGPVKSSQGSAPKTRSHPYGGY